MSIVESDVGGFFKSKRGNKKIKHGTPEPALRGGYGTFADSEESMCPREPRFCTVLLLGITPRGFGTYGHTPSGNVFWACGNLKNHNFSTFEQKFLSF